MSKIKGPYTWATENEFLRPVAVLGDGRQWFYTAKCMYKGEMHARIIGHDDIPNTDSCTIRKKLVPMRKVVFLAE